MDGWRREWGSEVPVAAGSGEGQLKGPDQVTRLSQG